jgi:serine protease SohB
MHEFFLNIGSFAAETLVIVLGFAGAAALVAGIFRAGRGGFSGQGRLEVEHLNQRFRDYAEILGEVVADPAERKRKGRFWRRRGAKKKSDADPGITRKRLFLLDFDGDINASQVAGLREEISALLQISRDGDEVLLRLESAGGTVHGYGLAASQLSRLRTRGLKLTVAVDKVAASGGYLMASVADRIVAAPFAILGSIGVVAQLPNFNRLLKSHAIDFELHTAGEFKRTLTIFGENTDAGREKFQRELDETHTLFKGFLADHRPQLDLARVATGEFWYGRQALDLRLVDELCTSDAVLLDEISQCEAYRLRFHPPRSLTERLSGGFLKMATAALGSLKTRATLANGQGLKDG